MLLLTFCDRSHCVQMLRRPRCNSALEILGALGPYFGPGVYAGASPRARVRDVRGRASVSSASGTIAAEAGPVPPPVGLEWAAVSARRGCQASQQQRSTEYAGAASPCARVVASEGASYGTVGRR